MNKQIKVFYEMHLVFGGDILQYRINQTQLEQRNEILSLYYFYTI